MLARKVALNTIVAVVGRIIATVLALVVFSILTRYLGVSGFGEYVTVMAYLSVFNMFTDLGLYSIAVRDISRDGVDESQILGNAFSIRFFVGIFIFTIGAILMYSFPYSQNIKRGFLVGALGYWAMTNQSLLVSVFQKYLRMDKIAIGEVLSRIVQLALVFYFVRHNFGFLFMIVAMVMGAVADLLFVIFSSRKFVKISFKFDFPFWKKILKESLPLGIGTILTLIYFKCDTIMLSWMKSTYDVGIYGVAYRVLESVIFFPNMFVGIIMPLLSRYVFTAKEKFREIFSRALDVLVIIIVPMIVGTFFLARDIIFLVGGQEFAAAAPVLCILIFATGIIFLGALFSYIIISFNKQKYLMYLYGFGAFFNVATNLYFIPKYSYYGAAGTTVATEFLVTVCMAIIIYRELKYLPPFLIVLLKALVASGAMAAGLYFLRGYGVQVTLPSAIAIYFIVLVLIRGIKKEEIMMLAGKS